MNGMIGKTRDSLPQPGRFMKTRKEGIFEMTILRVTTLGAALLALAACEPAPDTSGTGQDLANCGKIVTSQMASYTEAPITNEGAGKIGIGTQQQGSDGSVMQRFSLVDCADKSITKVQQNWTLATAPAKGDTVQDLVSRLREAGRLTASGQLAREGQSAGYQVTQGRVDTVANDRTRCGCTLHYPDLLWQ